MNTLESIKFCTNCGHPTEPREAFERMRPVCPNCGHIFYFAPLVAVAAVISNDDGKILLVCRGENPGRGLWGLPGGYVEIDETLGAALDREIREETGLVVQVDSLIGVWSFYHDSKQLSGASIIYRARLNGGVLEVGSDSTAALWVSEEEIGDLKLAFESHREAIGASWGSKYPI